MSKGDARKSFADIVREVQSTPKPTEHRRPGLYRNEFLDRDDRHYELVGKDVSERRALIAAQSGAQVVWDPCGCGGYCGLEWYTADDVRRMVSSGQPSISRRKNHQGRISEWYSGDGLTLLLAENWVTWGDALT